MQKRINFQLITLICSSLLFLLILFNISKKGFLFDLDILINSINLHNQFLITISTFIAYLFDTAPVIIFLFIVAAYLYLKKYRNESFFILLLAFFDGAFLLILKNIFHRARPINMLMPETSFSFPSGHATTAVILFGLISYFIFKHHKSQKFKLITLVLSAILTLIVGFSRLCLNVHWFSDVIAGFLLGIFLLTLSIYLLKIFENNFKHF